jgi:two-component system CheB/CheR fusion protein
VSRDDIALEGIVEDVRKASGQDLRSYKRAPVMRCIRRRMKSVGVTSVAQYRGMLASRGAEVFNLIDAVRNHTTMFYRDRDAWIVLAARLAERVAEAGPTDRIRVWCIGCSTGEEAYSIAMLFAELLGRDEASERVRIFATDIDESALSTARTGLFADHLVERLPASHRAAYFTKSSCGYAFDPRLRGAIVFGRHDILSDPPIPQLDLVICRNTLLYLEPKAQSQAMTRLHGVLEEGGLLFVGISEAGMVPRELFRTGDPENRFFERIEPVPPVRTGRHLGPTSHRRALYEAALERTTAMILVDDREHIAFLSQGAVAALGIPPGYEGLSVEDLVQSHGLSSLLPALRMLRADRASLQLRGVEGRGARFDVDLRPLLGPGEEWLGAEISFTCV